MKMSACKFFAFNALCAALLCASACSKSSQAPAADGSGRVQARVRALVPPAPNVDGFSYGEVFRVAHTAVGAVDLTDFQVQVTLNTALEITAGRMRSDCADIRVFAGDGCTPGTPVNFWVADGTCDTIATNIWLGLPSVLAGSVTSFAVYWGDPDAASLSDGPAVFPIFFDDFNAGSLDTDKWNAYAPEKLTQSGGLVTTAGGATAIWTKLKVMSAGQTVFGVRTNAKSAGGADIEYGAATLISTPTPTAIHFSNRNYTGVTYMSWDNTAALIGASPDPGSCVLDQFTGRWANAPEEPESWFQTEFFYEFVDNDMTRFGIYDKTGVKRETTAGSADCKPPATESAYYQWDHEDGAPNPISSLDYAYVRKYANPDPLISDRTPIAQILCRENGVGPCTVPTAVGDCISGTCSPNGLVCIPAAAGSCYVDDDCGGGQYCHRNELTCKTKLALGAALPADGLHNTCPSNDANAACASELCNGSTSTCAGVNGTSCNDAAECVVNVCDDSDDKCGYVSGGSCTDETEEVCRSSCGESGVCLPPNGCDSDSGCQAEEHCDLATLGCVSDLINGATIPTDHGACGGGAGSAGTAVDACSSGHCNEATNTCAAVNGGTCTGASGCESNVCGADSKCGYQNGTGTCSASDQAVVCRSGQCSEHGHVCIPAADSCWVDADCDTGEFCHQQTFTCTAKLAAGESLPVDGLHDACNGTVNSACATNHCNAVTTTCANVNGEACNDPSECETNVCDNTDDKCGYANGGGTCIAGMAAPACRSGICGSSDVCIPSGGCAVDGDCDTGEYCVVADLQCAPALANGYALPPGHGTCSTPGLAGSAQTACASELCNPVTNTCAGPNVSTSCSSASECVENLCGANNLCGLHRGQSGCDANTAAVVCQSGACSITTGVCIPSGPGHCWADADCSDSNQYCHRSTFLCTAKLPDGSLLPGDGLHNACPLNEVNAACTSGSCNRETGTCASSFLSACDEAADCISNVCDTDDMCGYDNGSGPCSADTQTHVCRSGECSSTTHRCIPAGGCGHDSDCDEGRFCRAGDFSCALVLSNGTLLPDGHGSCGGSPGSFGEVEAMCASGACNAATGTCAGPNTETSCTSASECVSNVCGNNGLCGYANGAGSICTPDNAANNCQSGQCSANGGSCVPEGEDKCWVDLDCADGHYCHRATFSCEPALVAGSLLPADGLHASCNVHGTSRACTTGLCDSGSHRCVAVNGEACDSADACLTHLCGGNGQCGYAIGEGPCDEDNAGTVCQTGACAPSGACVPPGENRCWVDSDCGPGNYCAREQHTCQARILSGEPVPNDGLHTGCSDGTSAACRTGLCSVDSGLCVASNNVSCEDADACLSGICGGNGLCGHADGEGPCTEADATGTCQSGKCGPGAVCISGDCWNDADCADGSYCYRPQQACRAPLPGGEPLPDDELHSDCDNGTNPACSTGLCNADNGLCLANNNQSCETSDACVSGVCGGNGLCGHADGEGPCSAEDAAASCQSGQCSPYSALCSSGECWLDVDCADGSYCHRAEQACRERVGPGWPVPNDGLHMGCVEGMSEACNTGLCNEDSGLCVASNNISCDSSDACVSAICGGNGLCGRADGEGPCSEDDAAVSCQSGKCSPHAEVCISGDCWVDDDCTSTEYCQQASQTCTSQGYSGQAVPDDRSCDDGKSRACMSGRCEDGRCVEPTSAFGLSGGGGCSATPSAADSGAGSSLLLLALAWLGCARRRARRAHNQETCKRA